MSYQYFGHYIIAKGAEFLVNSEHKVLRRLILNPHFWYVVDKNNGMVLGGYYDEDNAITLAKGLERLDLRVAAIEIDRMLTNEYPDKD